MSNQNIRLSSRMCYRVSLSTARWHFNTVCFLVMLPEMQLDSGVITLLTLRFNCKKYYFNVHLAIKLLSNFKARGKYLMEKFLILL